MKKILDELWFGNINPTEQSYILTPEMKQLQELMWRNRDKLENSLSSEQKEMLEKYDDTLSEFNSLSDMQIFIYGFRLGGRFMLSVFDGNIIE